MAQRWDAAPLRKATKDSFGFLRGEAYLGRTGVQVYRNKDGTERRELRLPEEVFHPDALASFALVPVTLGHPAEAVTPKNVKALSVGTVGEPRQDGRFLRALVSVTDAAAIDVVTKGGNKVSCGYNCDLEASAGITADGQAYDFIQRNIRGNHLAMNVVPRAGPEAELRVDGDDAYCIHDLNDEPGIHADATDKDTHVNLKKLTIDGVDCEIPLLAAQVVEKHLAKLTKDAADQTAALEKAKTDLLAANGRADQLDEQVKKLKEDASPAKMQEAIKARVALEAIATKHLGAEFKADGQDDIAIKKAFILKVSPTAKLDGQDPAYINARFDQAVESIGTLSLANVRSDAGKPGVTNVDADTAHAEMVKRNQAAWKTAAKA